MKPISFTEFDGGITDKDIPGRANRYSVCDNLLIDSAKKLLQRDGFDIYSSTAYQLGAAERVARLVNFDTDSEILAFQNKKAYAITAGAWAEVTGPGGGSSAQHAFNTNTAASLIQEAQWQHHLYAASDSGDPVVKMYRDSGSTMRLRTAGLPEWTSSLTPTDGGLADAVTLANSIRTKMIAHFGANGATAGVANNSSTGHHVTHADLTSQATAASATSACTNLSSLITLLNSLRSIYSLHIADAQVEDTQPVANSSAASYTWFKRKYHMMPASGYAAYDPFMQRTATANTGNQPLYIWRHYLNFTIADPELTIPSSAVIADVLPYLNDLRDKWNWHTYASMTHFNAAYWQGSSNFTYLGSHAVSESRVVPYTWASITPNHGPFLQFVTDLATEFASHRTNDMHIEDDTVWAPPSGVDTTPDDFWEAVTLMGWLAHGITYHALEPDTTFCANGTQGAIGYSASTTSGSPSLSLTATGGYSADQMKFMRVVPMVGLGSSPYQWGFYLATDQTKLYNITASDTSTPATFTCANNFNANHSNKQFVITSRRYHMGDAASALFDPVDLALDLDSFDFMLNSASSLQEFADWAKRLAGYLELHTVARLTANTSTASKLKINCKDYTTYYNSLATASATGTAIAIHAGMDNTNYPVTALIGTGGLYLSLNDAINSSRTAADQLAETRFRTAPTAAAFLYRAVFKYDYTVGTASFTDRSAPADPIEAIGFVNEDYAGVTESGKFAATLSNIYAFSNAANENYAHTDTTNFRKEIYRTLANGTRYYKVDVNGTGGDITNATTSFSDYSSDTFLVDQLELYTNGGAPENNKPPISTGIHIFNNVGLYVSGNKVYQSIPKDPDSVPSDFYEEFEENVVAVSSTRSVAVAFTATKVHRLVGGFDSLGRGSLTHDPIFDRTGAISAQSVVKGDNGVFFAGKDGFYYTDGYQCMRVSDLETTFRTLTTTSAKRNMIHGTYDNISKKVYWTVQTGSSSYPDKIWVLDLQFGIKPDATPITTLSKTSGFNPTALTFFNGQIYYGDGDGYVFVQTRGLNMDLVKDTGTAATSWAKEATRWDFKTCHYNYGTDAIRKFFQRATVEFEMQSTNVSCQITSDSDKGYIQSDLPVIRSRKSTDWGDSKLDWISSVYPAKAGSVVDEWRNFKGDGSLRSNYRAVELKTAYCVIVKSGDMGTVTIANVAGNVYTVTLTSLVGTRKWPLYSVGYFIRINSVDYPVTVRTSDSVVRIDSTGLTSPTTGVPSSWELWGYPKNERVRLIALSIGTDLEDDNQTSSLGPVITGGQNSA